MLKYLEPVAQHIETCLACKHTSEPCPTASAIFDACAALAAAAGVHLVPDAERARTKA
jgi:hypothetical protein